MQLGMAFVKGRMLAETSFPEPPLEPLEKGHI